MHWATSLTSLGAVCHCCGHEKVQTYVRLNNLTLIPEASMLRVVLPHLARLTEQRAQLLTVR